MNTMLLLCRDTNQTPKLDSSHTQPISEEITSNPSNLVRVTRSTEHVQLVRYQTLVHGIRSRMPRWELCRRRCIITKDATPT
ncbi:unnamed protein product [Rotaria sordida]|uniref:Uncharacterized protein n=1 Tax=Rotaria sordida TaxID=392033 RepID=A0A815IAK9_9BILA|nr:unnamed protein product [Rotaria sordida]